MCFFIFTPRTSPRGLFDSNRMNGRNFSNPSGYLRGRDPENLGASRWKTRDSVTYLHANVSSNVFGRGRLYTGLRGCEKFPRRAGNTIRRYIAGTCRVYRNGRRLTSTLVHTRTEHTHARIRITRTQTQWKRSARTCAHDLHCTGGPHLRKEALY